jgi:acyl carrier protein
MDPIDIRNLILEFIAGELLEQDAGDLDQHTPLLEWGVLDSLNMVALLSFIESRFGVVIPDDDVVPQNFFTVAAIEALIVERNEIEVQAHA